jgi:valine dehydrogenase (NAD+)
LPQLGALLCDVVHVSITGTRWMGGRYGDAVTDSGVFSALGDEFEEVVFGHHPATGLRCIIAVHSTALGPSLGGTRFMAYPDERAALLDVLRLARGMTHKQAAAGLDLGGGKAVIIGDPRTHRTEPLVRAYGRQVHRLGGCYLTAEDVGTTQADMDLIAEETSYVTGTSPESGGSGDPSPATAWGIFWAIRAAASHRWGDNDLNGRRVTVLGVGKVGRGLVDHLVEAGAVVTIADVADVAVQSVLADHPSVATVTPDEALTHPADVLAPCALGGLLDKHTIPGLAAQVVCGAANNQLAVPADAEKLSQSDVLYVPDFVANAGGVINIADELNGTYDRDRAFARVQRIGDNVTKVLEVATRDSITTETAAHQIVTNRLAAAGAPSAP